MTLTPANGSDAALLASLHARCFAQAWDLRAFSELLNGENTWAIVAREDEIPGGFVMVRFAADEAEILTLGVVPEHRRRGLARALVLCASKGACEAGARTLFLEVGVNNAPARALYRRLGFDKVGRRTGYYRTCESLADALVLRSALPIPAWESEGNSISLPMRRD